MANSLKKNFGFNLILTLCNYLFPLLTYPYVSRVLGVEKIGLCNYVDGIVNYFVLFSMLGVGSFGVREIAKCGNDKEKRSSVFTNLIIINALCTIFCLVILVSITTIFSRFQPYREFLWIGIVKLVFNLFLVEWFFQGLQEFKYITIRSVAVRFFYVICIFLFIHDKNDTLLYYALTCSIIAINAILNWNHAKSFCRIALEKINLKAFFLPVLTFGYYRILTSMYTTFNVVFLGFTNGDEEVGLFTTATKLYTILMSVFTAFTTVMVPKVSELLSKGDKNKLQVMANQVFSLLIALTLPVIIFCLFNAEGIIYLLAGPGYERANVPFRIVIFMLFVIGTEQIVVQQFLMASKKSSPIAILSTAGAITGIVLNLLITSKIGAIGSSISWSISEVVVLSLGLYYLRANMDIFFNYKELIVDIMYSMLYVIPLVIISLCVDDRWISLFFSAIISCLIFLLINVFLHKKEPLVNLINKFSKKASFEKKLP